MDKPTTLTRRWLRSRLVIDSKRADVVPAEPPQIAGIQEAVTQQRLSVAELHQQPIVEHSGVVMHRQLELDQFAGLGARRTVE